MAVSPGYDQLQPNFVLGTGQWVSSVAEQMVGADIDKVNQLRDHFPFFPIAHGNKIIVPRVAGLASAKFTDRQAPQSDDSLTKLVDVPEEVELVCIEGSVNLSDYALDVQSYDIDQLDLQIEFKKIAIRVAFWQQFFSSDLPNGFKGLPDLVASSQVNELNQSIELSDLDALVAEVTEADAEMDSKVIVMNSSTFKYYAKLVRSAETAMTYTTYNGRRYASHNGVPILLCDYIREQGRCNDRGVDVWCMTLGMEDNGLFGIIPEDSGDGGLVIEQAQGGADTSSMIYRLRWYCSVILGQFRGLAGLTNVHVS